MASKKKKPNRKTLFVDIPVTSKTRDKVRLAKKKKQCRTFDELLDKTMSDILGVELNVPS